MAIFLRQRFITFSFIITFSIYSIVIPIYFTIAAVHKNVTVFAFIFADIFIS